MSQSASAIGRVFLALVATIAAATPAQAYVGPGAGLTAIGAFVALIAAVVVSLVAFVWLPIKRRLRRRGAAQQLAHDDE